MTMQMGGSGFALIDRRGLEGARAFDVPAQVRGRFLVLAGFEQVQDLKVLAALASEPGAVEGRYPILDEPAQAVDPLDGVEEELIAAATHDGLVQFGIDLEQVRAREALQAAFQDGLLLVARPLEGVAVDFVRRLEHGGGLNGGTE